MKNITTLQLCKFLTIIILLFSLFSNYVFINVFMNMSSEDLLELQTTLQNIPMFVENFPQNVSDMIEEMAVDYKRYLNTSKEREVSSGVPPVYYEKCTTNCKIIYEAPINKTCQALNLTLDKNGNPIFDYHPHFITELMPGGEEITTYYDISGHLTQKMHCHRHCIMNKIECKPLDFSELLKEN